MLIPLAANVQMLLLSGGRLTELSEEKPLTCGHTFKRVSEFFNLLKNSGNIKGLRKDIMVGLPCCQSMDLGFHH